MRGLSASAIEVALIKCARILWDQCTSAQKAALVAGTLPDCIGAEERVEARAACLTAFLLSTVLPLVRSRFPSRAITGLPRLVVTSFPGLGICFKKRRLTKRISESAHPI